MSSADRCGSELRSRYLPSRFSSAAIFVFVDAQESARGQTQEPLESLLGRQDSGELAPLDLGKGHPKDVQFTLELARTPVAAPKSALSGGQ